MWTTFFLYFLWVLVASYFLPLLIVFVPAMATILYIVPTLFMKLPIQIVRAISRKLDVKISSTTSLLEMKVMAAATVVAVVSSMGFKAFYADPSTWSDLFTEELAELVTELEEVAKIFSQLATLSFNFDGLSFAWPSGLEFPQQLPLIMSVGLLGNKYLLAGFKFCYREYSLEDWGEEWADTTDGINAKIEWCKETLTLGGEFLCWEG